MVSTLTYLYNVVDEVNALLKNELEKQHVKLLCECYRV